MALRVSLVAACVAGGAAVKLDAAAGAEAGAVSAVSIQGSRTHMLANLRPDRIGKPFNETECERYPAFCKPPFNCHNHVFKLKDLATSLNVDGHSNLNVWCNRLLAPSYYSYLKECIADKDLKKAAQTQYQWSLDQKNGVDELDGSYCFIEGHCSNEAVTENTTVAEAEAMCDQRYGHEGWTSQFNLGSQMRAQLPGFALSLLTHGGPQNGFTNQRTTEVFLKAACAMGNYHCDVMYCKETYCKNEHYATKYKHLMPAKPGNLLAQIGLNANLM